MSSASIVPTVLPAGGMRSEVAAATWSSRTGTTSGSAAKRIRICYGPGTAESLEQLLKHEPGGHELLSALERSCENRDFGSVRGPVATESKRPDARVDEQRQPRERSAL